MPTSDQDWGDQNWVYTSSNTYQDDSLQQEVEKLKEEIKRLKSSLAILDKSTFHSSKEFFTVQSITFVEGEKRITLDYKTIVELLQSRSNKFDLLLKD